jgi:pterin-4a-carbinolamine dehydratase
MNSRIFISYRRLDSEPEAGRLLTTLQGELPDAHVFMDTSSISPGSKWPDEIKGALTSATLVIVLIGPDWLRAGSDAWGRRPVDRPDDWVRLEVTSALTAGKRILPVLVRDAQMPPSEVLPETMRPVADCQTLEIRGAYWDHDVKLLFRQIAQTEETAGRMEADVELYPIPPSDETIEAIDDVKLATALRGTLRGWVRVESTVPDGEGTRIELFREYKFQTFQDAVGFMSQVAKGCDIANHHPRWENIWKTLRVFLTTWNIGHRISDRDIQLAKYFDTAYAQFPGRLRL